MCINKELINYIENNIFKEYEKNDSGHNLNHILYVIERSLKFANEVENINYNIVYTVASYHDIGHHIDAKNHEKISAEIMINDNNLMKFFSLEELKIIYDAICDHRASNDYEPRTIYGKIVSSADRNTSIDDLIKRTYYYRIKHNPNDTLDSVIEESRIHIIDKFGRCGYAKEKMYFKDEEYEKFLDDIDLYTKDKKIFKDKYIKVNKLDNDLILYYNELKRRNICKNEEDIITTMYHLLSNKYNLSYNSFRNKVLEENNIKTDIKIRNK